MQNVSNMNHQASYNNIFSFTSFGVKLDKELTSSRKRVYTFRGQRQIHHDLSSLLPSNDSPCFFQVYSYNITNEVQNRLQVLKNLALNKAIIH